MMFLHFPEDDVIVDPTDIVYVQALTERQRIRSQSEYQTLVNLRPQGSGPLYLRTGYDDVVGAIFEIASRGAVNG